MTFRHAVLTAALWAVFSCPAQAHSWYPLECCSERDCAPLDARKVTETEAGYLLDTGEFIERKKARFSPDEDFHICRFPSGGVICFFVPNRGF
jgi:hypothetical protein